MTKRKEKKRIVVALPVEAAARIQAVREDLIQRSGRNLTAGQAMLVALGLAERVAGSRAYLLTEEAVVKIVARQVPEIVANVLRELTGKVVTYSTTESGATTFLFAGDEDKRATFVPSVLASLTEYELN